MKIKSLNKTKKCFLLVIYLFMVIASLFHHHSYSLTSGDRNAISIPNKSEAANDFLEGSAGICLLDHFLQTIIHSDHFAVGKTAYLPKPEKLAIHSVLFPLDKLFYYAYPLRAPPTI